MKYIMGVLFAVLGFINILAPEWIKNPNAMFATICFALGGVLINYKKED